MDREKLSFQKIANSVTEMTYQIQDISFHKKDQIF